MKYIIPLAIAAILLMIHVSTMTIMAEHERVRADYMTVLDRVAYIEGRFIGIKEVAIRSRKGIKE